MWLDKTYHTLNYELQKKFQSKVIKLPINAGFTCPTRDGSKGYDGCIFCSESGSGDFAEKKEVSIISQMQAQRDVLLDKWPAAKYIAYFQNFSNTYSDLDDLQDKYLEALSFNDTVGIAIATRADCIDEDTARLLGQISEKSFLWIELGLQTVNEKSATFIRRGYELDVFENAVRLLKKYNIKIVVHLILNLPGEDKEDYFNAVRYLSENNIWGVKIHMLHILKNTDLEKYYSDHPFPIIEADLYISTICDILEVLPADMVVHRLTGDGSKDSLIAPRWTLNKRYILNGIDKEMKRRNSFQGMKHENFMKIDID